MWFETSLSSVGLRDWIDQDLERNIAFAPIKRLVTSLELSLEDGLFDIYSSARRAMTCLAFNFRFWDLVQAVPNNSVVLRAWLVHSLPLAC